MSEDLGPALDRAQRRLRDATAERSGAVVESFLAGRHEPTRSAYRHDIEAFGAHLRGHGVDLLNARPDNVVAHVAELQGTGARPATVRRRLAALAGLYRHARALGVSSTDPLAGVVRPRDPVRPPSSSPSGDRTPGLAAGAEALVRAADALGTRDRALVLLLTQAGLRLGEALALDVGDLLAGVGAGADGVGLRVGSARRDARELIVPVACADACRRLTRERRDGPLLMTIGGRRLDRHHARRIVCRVGARAGLGDRVTPRTLREGFIARALAAGVETGALAAAVGLGDPRRLRRYGPAADHAEATRSVAVRVADPS